MAACGSLQHIFEKPLPENPTLLDSLTSWNQIKSMKPLEDSSFTEIFGELHFKEKPHSSSSSSSSLPLSSPSFLIDFNPQPNGLENLLKNNHNNNNNNGGNKSPSFDYSPTTHQKQYLGSPRNINSYSSMNSESLQLCTEGLGFESSGDVEDLKSDVNDDWLNQEERRATTTTTKHTPPPPPSEYLCGELRRSRMSGGAFPPPISCIGKTGKPWVCFKSYRQEGRFVLKEVRIPTQEFLHACREDGRLKLRFVHSDDEILEDKEEEDEEEQDEEQRNEEIDGGSIDEDYRESGKKENEIVEINRGVTLEATLDK
ncbi:protein FANTASTIC FOUR 2 [Cornus florida]|uniref:protein FANTASTIC FOUR 2 n=1 Tax=Cornus florida TaxID=4283 RepID=UPI00289C11E2|nr:protein FANTASTIC FOUR 2 [Cornus florida]